MFITDAGMHTMHGIHSTQVCMVRLAAELELWRKIGWWEIPPYLYPHTCQLISHSRRTAFGSLAQEMGR